MQERPPHAGGLEAGPVLAEMLRQSAEGMLAALQDMTDDELRHALGNRVFDAFAPSGRLTQHDAEDPDNLLHIGLTEQGEDVEINKRAATSDLIVYVNINLVAMDGGWKSTAFFHRVLLEPVRSAEPERSSGTTSWMASRTLSESFLEAMAGSVGLYVGRAFCQPSGRSPVNRRDRSA